MMRILDRYVFNEVIPSFFLGVVVFTFVILLNEILRFAQRLVSQSASFADTLAVLLNLLPAVLCITIPMGFLLGVLVALGRLASDSEIVAMRASGVSLYRLLVPVMIASTLAWAASSYLIIRVQPDSNQNVRQVLYKIITSQAGTEVRPRVFYDRLFPNWMFLVLDTPPGVEHWENVILADLSQPQSPRLTFASRGRLLVNPDERNVTFFLEDAELHQVRHRRPADYQRQVSREIFLPLPTDTFFPPEDLTIPRGAREMGLTQLATSYQETGLPVYLTEIYKKFSIPFACFVFGVLGVGFGIRNRRDGKSWGFVVSLGVIFVYYVMLNVGENMAITGRTPPLVGMWTPNVVLGIAAIALLIRAARDSRGGIPGIDHLWAAMVNKWKFLKRRRASADKTVVIIRLPRVSWSFPNTLDRYIGREFTKFFFLILSALMTVYILGLLIEVIPDAFQHNIPGRTVFQYVFFEQPQILFHMLPLSTLTATLVCFAILTKTSELIAAKAGGVSMYRVAVPVVLIGIGVSVSCFAIQEYMLPYTNRRAAELRDEIKKRPVQTHNVLNRKWMMGENDVLYNYAYYDQNLRKFSGLNVYEFSTKPFSLVGRFFAQEAQWESERGGWVLSKGWKRDFDEGREFEEFETQVVHDMEPPSYFVKEEKQSEQMTYLELTNYVEDLSQAGYDVTPLQVARHAKFSFPLAAMVTVLIGIPFSFTPGKKGALYGIGIAIAIGLSYYVTTRIFAFMGETAMLPPLIAAWSPNALFAVAALYGLFNVRT